MRFDGLGHRIRGKQESDVRRFPCTLNISALNEIAQEISIFDGGIWKLMLLAALALYKVTQGTKGGEQVRKGMSV